MTYACYAWYRDIHQAPDESTLEELFQQKDCNLWQDATAYVDDDGTIGEYTAGSGDVYCGQHDDQRVRWVESDELTNWLLEQLEESDEYWTCREHNSDWEAVIFRNANDYHAHRHEHGDEPVELATPTTPTSPSPCNHPPLTADIRARIRTHIQTGRQGTNPGMLVHPTNPVRITMAARAATPDDINRWLRNWPDYFHILLTDPHLHDLQGRSSHTSWT